MLRHEGFKPIMPAIPQQHEGDRARDRHHTRLQPRAAQDAR